MMSMTTLRVRCSSETKTQKFQISESLEIRHRSIALLQNLKKAWTSKMRLTINNDRQKLEAEIGLKKKIAFK
jgi:hypothetical protein